MASQLSRIQAFAEDARTARSTADLKSIMLDAVHGLGADYFMMVHHADFRRETDGLIKIHNYPQEMIDISRAGSALVGDAVMEACERTLTGFFWNEVGNFVQLDRRHHERAERVRRTGLADGYVVPAHVPGEHLGSCHFAVGWGKHVPRENSAALQSVAIFGFEAARRLVREESGSFHHFGALTDRQRECVLLAARGKSDSVIGQLLGLSPKTVSNYLENAKGRFGVATRSQLVVRALYASEISFHDIVDGLRSEANVSDGNWANDTIGRALRSSALGRSGEAARP